MSYFKSKLLIAIVIFVAIMLSIYGTIYFICTRYLTPTQIQSFITQRSEALLKRKLTVDDDIEYKIDWDLSPQVTIAKVVLANMPGSKNPEMISVETLELTIDLFALLFKQIRITGLTLINPVINLESIDDKNNWDFDLANNDASHTITVKEIEIVGGVITYRKDNGQLTKLSVKTLDVEANDANTHFKIKLKGSYNQTDLYAKLGLTFNADEFDIVVKEIEYGDVEIDGKLNIDRKSKEVTAKFNADKIDLDTLIGPTNPSSSGEYSISKASIPTDFLRDSKIDFKFKIDEFKFHDIKLNKFTFKVTTKDNIINFNFDPALKIAGGKVDVSAQYNLQAATPVFTFNLKTSNLQFETLLKQFAGQSPISGSILDIDCNLQGYGTTYADIVNSLNGKMLITASSGKYLNSSGSIQNIFANVLAGVITFKKTESNTAFNCGVMNFKVNNGIANAHHGVAIEAASVHVLGNGMIDLRNGRINFSIVPKNTSIINSVDITKFSIAQAVSVSGTISKPQIVYNPVKMVTSNLMKAGLVAGGVIGWQIGLAAIAKDVIMPEKEDNGSPCKTALAQ